MYSAVNISRTARCAVNVTRFITKNPCFSVRYTRAASTCLLHKFASIRCVSTNALEEEEEYIDPDAVLRDIKNILKSKGSLSKDIALSLTNKSVLSDLDKSQMSLIVKSFEQCSFEKESDRSVVYSGILISCCNIRDYIDGHKIIMNAASHQILQTLPVPAFNSVFLMLFKYKQYNKIVDLYEVMSGNNIILDKNIMLSIIRSYGNCQQVANATKLMRSTLLQIDSILQNSKNEDKEENFSLMLKVYSAGIEVLCHNQRNEDALKLLHEMADKTDNKMPIPRSCYLLMFSHFSSDGNSDNKVIKASLDEILSICESTGCDKQEVFNHYILGLMKSGNTKDAREVAINALHTNPFNAQTYTYLLIGINHSLGDRSKTVTDAGEEEKAQVLALVMTLMHNYRKQCTPAVDFYLQMITLLGHYREYDKLDSVIAYMNKDKIPFDGRIYSALIDAFEDTQLVIDIYNDAKNNVPASDPYSSLLFPEDTVSQEYLQFPKVIECAKLKQSACKTTILRELSTMDVNSLETVHDLIFVTDYFTPAKHAYNTVTSVLNSLNIFWFQGTRDGRIYVTRDSIIDYLTEIDENKHVWGLKKLVIMRSKFIPILLLLAPLPFAYEIFKNLL